MKYLFRPWNDLLKREALFSRENVSTMTGPRGRYWMNSAPAPSGKSHWKNHGRLPREPGRFDSLLFGGRNDEGRTGTESGAEAHRNEKVEKELYSAGFRHIAGVGRGWPRPLAGPVVAAAVISRKALTSWELTIRKSSPKRSGKLFSIRSSGAPSHTASASWTITSSTGSTFCRRQGLR